MTDYLVYESPSGENVLRSRISRDGNWLVANHRPAGESLKRSDLFIFNIKDLNKPLSFNLTKDPSVIREDPNIAIVDSDSAIVVWGQDSTPDTEDNYDIYAAVVTGMSQDAPVLGTPVLLAAGEGGTGWGNRFPVIHADLVAWSYQWRDPDSQTVQYMSIADLNPVTAPRILRWRTTGATFELTFQSTTGMQYTVESSDALKTPPAWTALTPVTATTTETTVSDTNLVASARFYRVKAERP